jgi:predicted porin
MKKSLLALAALSAFATAAQAQSSVTVYGILDAGYNSLENKTSGAAASTTETTQIRTNGEASTSRFGFRGTEDLGGGVKANFVMESNIGNTNANNAAASNTLGDRQFWVGLEDAKMGQLRVGLQDTAIRSNWLAHDQLAFANVAGNLAHNGNGSGAASVSHTAFNTAVNYISPRMSGVQLLLGMTQNEVETTGVNKTKTGSGSQVGLNYAAGKFSVGAAYVESTTSTNAVAEVAAVAGNAGTAAAAAADTKTKDTSVAASYDFGIAKVAYIYNKRDAKNSAAVFSTANIQRESNAFSASFPLTPKLTGRLGYGYGENQVGTAAAEGYKGDIKGYQAALNYSLSKRTTIYGIYGNEKRDTAANADVESKEYSVGVRHSF